MDAEVFYSTLPPEAVNSGTSNEIEKPQDSVSDHPSGRRWMRRVIVALVLIVVAALAIGLGIPLQKETKTRSGSPPIVR